MANKIRMHRLVKQHLRDHAVDNVKETFHNDDTVTMVLEDVGLLASLSIERLINNLGIEDADMVLNPNGLAYWVIKFPIDVTVRGAYHEYDD